MQICPDSGEKEQEIYSGCVMKKEQRVCTKIECLRGVMPSSQAIPQAISRNPENI